MIVIQSDAANVTKLGFDLALKSQTLAAQNPQKATSKHFLSYP
jgi:hypothetical protein